MRKLEGKLLNCSIHQFYVPGNSCTPAILILSNHQTASFFSLIIIYGNSFWCANWHWFLLRINTGTGKWVCSIALGWEEGLICCLTLSKQPSRMRCHGNGETFNQDFVSQTSRAQLARYYSVWRQYHTYISPNWQYILTSIHLSADFPCFLALIFALAQAYPSSPAWFVIANLWFWKLMETSCMWAVEIMSFRIWVCLLPSS